MSLPTVVTSYCCVNIAKGCQGATRTAPSLVSGHCYTFNHTRSRVCMLQCGRSNISHTPTGRTHFSFWQEGARWLHLAAVHMGTKSLRCFTELKHLRVFFCHQNARHDEAWMVLRQVHDTNWKAKGEPERVFTVIILLPNETHATRGCYSCTCWSRFVQDQLKMTTN